MSCSYQIGIFGIHVDSEGLHATRVADVGAVNYVTSLIHNPRDRVWADLSHLNANSSGCFLPSPSLSSISKTLL